MEAKRTLRKDLTSPLDEVSRAWIRIPATLLIGFLLVFPVALFYGIVTGYFKDTMIVWWKLFIIKCLKGNERD